MKVNDYITFYDSGGLWNAQIKKINKKSLEVLVNQDFCHITDPKIHFIAKDIAIISKKRIISHNGKDIAPSIEGARIIQSVADAMTLFGC
jgi:hypothetical protein